MEHISKILNHNGGIFTPADRMCPIGDRDLNNFLGGLPTDPGIITIAAEGGTGKSRFIKTLLFYLSVKQKYACAYFSGRQNVEREADVFLGGALGLSFEDLTTSSIPAEKREQAVKAYAGSSLYYDSFIETGLRIEVMREKLHSVYQSPKAVNFIFIDGFQELKWKKESDCRETERLKAVELLKISREFNAPVIVTSLLNWRFYERDGSSRPCLRDLAGVGDLQEYSNFVIGLYSPERDWITLDVQGHDLRGTTEISILKNNFGTCKKGLFSTKGPIFKYKYLSDINSDFI